MSRDPCEITGPAVAFFRPEDEGVGLQLALAARGLEAIHVPLIAFDTGPDQRRLDREIESGEGWVVITSRRGANCLAKHRREWAKKGFRIASVGAATRAALELIGLPVEIEGTGGAAGLLRSFPEDLRGVTVLWPTGDRSASLLEEGLQERGATVHRLEVYLTKLLRFDHRQGKALERSRALLFTSPSTVQALAGALGDRFAGFLDGRVVGVLGGHTGDALSAFGSWDLVMPENPRISDLVSAVAASLGIEDD